MFTIQYFLQENIKKNFDLFFGENGGEDRFKFIFIRDNLYQLIHCTQLEVLSNIQIIK